jgi:hypothetical protein
MRVVSGGAPSKLDFVKVVKGHIYIVCMVISYACYFPLRVKSRLKTEIISCVIKFIVMYQ